MGTFDIVDALEEYLRATCAVEQDPSQENEQRRTRAVTALVGALSPLAMVCMVAAKLVSAGLVAWYMHELRGA